MIRARMTSVLGCSALLLALLRCAPSPDECVRMSDCGSGLVCVDGQCRTPASSTPGDASAAEASVSDASRPEASVVVDASTPTPEASVDAGSDSGEPEEEEDTDDASAP